jgi:hypothetical protein
MKSLNEYIKRVALTIVTADLLDNFKDTWKKVNKDPARFKRVTDPFILRHLGVNANPQDISKLREIVLEATDGAITLTNDGNNWSTKKKPETRPESIKPLR